MRSYFLVAPLVLAAAQACWAVTPADYEHELLGLDRAQLERLTCGNRGLKASKIVGHSRTPDIGSTYGADVECVPAIRDGRSIQYLAGCSRDSEQPWSHEQDEQEWQCEPLRSITRTAVQFGSRTLWATLQGDLSRRKAQAAFSYVYKKIKAGDYVGEPFDAEKFRSPCIVAARASGDVDIICNGLPVTVQWDAQPP